MLWLVGGFEFEIVECYDGIDGVSTSGIDLLSLSMCRTRSFTFAGVSCISRLIIVRY